MPLPALATADLQPFATLLRAGNGQATPFPEVLQPGDVPGRHAFSILCPQPVSGPEVSITWLERHPHSTQSFLPLSVGRWIVLLAPTLADGSPNTANIQAFMAGPEDAICIGRNVWHAGLTVLDQPAQMGMLMWRAEAGDDGVVHQLATPITLQIE